MPPFDLQKILELAPLAIGALKPGSPEAAAMMRGYMRSKQVLDEQARRNAADARASELQDAQLVNLTRDNQRADEQLALQRDAAERQRMQAFYSAIPDLQAQAVEQASNPVDAQAAYIRSKASAAQDFGVPLSAGQALPNMTDLIGQKQITQAKGLIAEFDQKWGKDPQGAEMEQQTVGFGPFAGKTFAQVRQIAQALPNPPVRAPKADPVDQVWVVRDGKVTPIQKGTARPGDVPYEKGAVDAKDTTTSDYTATRTERVLDSARTLRKKVSRWTVGYGSKLAGIPETEAADFKAELDTLIANIAFSELAEMRAASKTGGALGQVSNTELGLLGSVQGALDRNQSPENFAAQLDKIIGSLERWKEAKARYGAPALSPATMLPASSHESGETDSALSILEQRRRQRGGR